MTTLTKYTTPGISPKLALTERWPLQRLLMFGLANAFFGLMCDVRIEHVAVVRQQSIAWTPILFAAFTSVACMVATMWRNPTMNRVMVPLFILAIVVGAVGFYLHNRGHLFDVAKVVISAWTDPRMQHEDEPPLLAPMAFAGLGVLGLLACAASWRRENER